MALLALLACTAAVADPPPSPDPQGASGASGSGAARPPVALDALLRLPPGNAPAEQPRAGGATRQDWQDRFAAARADVEAARQAIDKAQQELGQMAESSDPWTMSAPGAPAGSETSPLSYRLRQELRRQRDELASAERRLTELEVEANLAGVPEAWTRPDASQTPPQTAPAQ